MTLVISDELLLSKLFFIRRIDGVTYITLPTRYFLRVPDAVFLSFLQKRRNNKFRWIHRFRIHCCERKSVYIVKWKYKIIETIIFELKKNHEENGFIYFIFV